MGNWWDNGNDLALIDAMRKFARDEDGDWNGPVHSRFNSGLIGLARSMGMPEAQIRTMFNAEDNLVIYAP